MSSGENAEADAGQLQAARNSSAPMAASTMVTSEVIGFMARTP